MCSSDLIPAVDLPPAPDPGLDPSGYLRSIYAVRERSRFVREAALRNQLTNFTVDMDKFSDVAEYVVSIIKVSSGWEFWLGVLVGRFGWAFWLRVLARSFGWLAWLVGAHTGTAERLRSTLPHHPAARSVAAL